MFDNVLNVIGDQQEERRRRKKRVYIERNREAGNIRLWNDYFSETPTYPDNLFRRRFRMNKPLFTKIVDRLSNEMEFFQQKQNGLGRLGLSTLQKCTAVIRVLAYGHAADAVDEYLQLGSTNTRSCLENFVEGIINFFGNEYLRRPTPGDLQRLFDIGASWISRDDRKHRMYALRVEELSYHLEMSIFTWFGKTHDRFRSGTLNDINILDRSPVFDDIIKGQARQVTYSVNRREYHLAYYLTDGIYPKWTTFIQSIPIPQGPKAVLFAQYQEAVRKDVERAFGVLQARFAIVKNPSLFWDKELLISSKASASPLVPTPFRREARAIGDVIGVERVMREIEAIEGEAGVQRGVVVCMGIERDVGIGAGRAQICDGPSHAKSRPCIGSGAGVGVLHQGGNGGGAKMTEEERGEEM
uniref:Nuclease HARBI1 n=1 Tax=Brassica oleracea var. oleracea TaxID=109376 RepID=A0A0D3E394_BRAOL